MRPLHTLNSQSVKNVCKSGFLKRQFTQNKLIKKAKQISIFGCNCFLHLSLTIFGVTKVFKLKLTCKSVC